MLLNRRLWPFPQPSERGTDLVGGDTDQCVQLISNGMIYTRG
jgi:hypothetical protein